MHTDFRQTGARLRQRIEELRRAVVRDREEIAPWRGHDGDLESGQDPALDDSGWPVLESWDGATAPAWYRARFRVPERFDGQPVSLSLRVGGYLHSLFNAEALVYVDGELAQGLVAFPVDINATHATYEIQFGSIQRPVHRSTPRDQARFEVSAQKWADLSEGDYGVSLLNDCK